MLCSEWKLIQAFRYMKIWPFSPGKGALTLPSHSGSISPTFLCPMFQVPCQGILQSLEYRALGNATQLCMDSFIPQGLPRPDAGAIEKNKSEFLPTQSTQPRHIVTLSMPHKYNYERTVGLAVFSEASVCLSSALSWWCRSLFSLQKAHPALWLWPSLRASKATAESFTSNPALNASSLRGCQALRAGTESCPHLHSIPWLIESRQLNLPILKCPPL